MVEKHGASKTPEYRAFKSARQRCIMPDHPRYERYGGRGIKFLFTSFAQFIAHIGPRPSTKHSLDRKDNDGHYEPGNVRWATKEEQLSTREWGGFIPDATRATPPTVVIFTRHKESCPLLGQEFHHDCNCRKWLRWSVTTQTGNVQHRKTTWTSALSLADGKRQLLQTKLNEQCLPM